MSKKKIILTLERDGKTVKGSPSYLAKKIGTRRQRIINTLYCVRRGKSYRVAGWYIIAEKCMGGHLLRYEYTDPGTIAEAVQEAEMETVNKPVKVEDRYLLRRSSKKRNCMFCALCYLPNKCDAYNDICGDDGIFIDLQGGCSKYEIAKGTQIL